MSIENIIDYVIKTPKNTNPNVIRSLVKSEVDENTLAKAKEYTDSQRLAYAHSTSTTVLPETVAIFHQEMSGLYQMVSFDYDRVNAAIGVLKSIGAFEVLASEAKFPVKVTLDGKTYDTNMIMQDANNIFFGDISLAGDGNESTGEPFVGAFSSGNVIVITTEYAESRTVKIEAVTETIHRIDPKYLPDGMGGYTEKPPAITFDGKPSPDAVFVDDTMLMISEKVYDINSIERITANINGETVVVDKSEMFVSDGVSLVGTVNGDQYTFVAILPYAIADSMGVEKGTYILYDDAVDGEVKVYTAKVEFSETIHPIDPKFLPNMDNSVTLDLKSLGLTLEVLFSGVEIPIGQEQIELVDYAYNNQSDIVIVDDQSIGTLYKDIRKFRLSLNSMSYLDNDGANSRLLMYSGLTAYPTQLGLIIVFELIIEYKTDLSSGTVKGVVVKELSTSVT